jgi:hypothetical protein
VSPYSTTDRQPTTGSARIEREDDAPDEKRKVGSSILLLTTAHIGVSTYRGVNAVVSDVTAVKLFR